MNTWFQSGAPVALACRAFLRSCLLTTRLPVPPRLEKLQTQLLARSPPPRGSSETRPSVYSPDDQSLAVQSHLLADMHYACRLKVTISSTTVGTVAASTIASKWSAPVWHSANRNVKCHVAIGLPVQMPTDLCSGIRSEILSREESCNVSLTHALWLRCLADG